MKFVLMIFGFDLALAALLFGVAGRTDLPWFWALLATHGAMMLALGRVMDDDLMRERLHPGPGAIDRGFRPALTACLLVHVVVAALDAGRFGWSPALPPAARAAALVVYAFGMGLALRAMAANRFFSPVVRLQTDRGHRVVTGGPYRFVRHPGYAGMLIAVFAECAVFGSLWAAVPAVMLAATVAYRTALEDRFLRDSLDGYAAYARGVRFRLVPCVW